jgi:hypothetical protein
LPVHLLQKKIIDYISSPEYNKFLYKNVLSSLTFSQIWLIPLVDDCQSTYFKELEKKKRKKKNPASNG